MNLFKIAAALTLNSSAYEKGLRDAEGEAKNFGSRLASGLGTAAKIGGAALGAAATAVADLTKNAIKNYAEYEQLVGGVETLFEKSADKVIGYASDAYKTAGLSANEYMETVTSFSASLLQSLGGDTDKAADVADRAIRDMSDNANKMGTSMESIQAAYQGFAKQNYTMLDNLKLGYGGTKTEMERLILDAESLNSAFSATRDENGELAMSFADIVTAIGIVQDDIGITGTTAAEASATISGSLSSMQSAWQNLVTGLADSDADIDGLMNSFVDSVSTAAKNLIPRISVAFRGISQLVKNIAPVIAEALPTLIQDVLPELTSSATELLVGTANALVENFPILASTALDIVEQLATTLGELAPVLIPSIVEAVLLVAETLVNRLPDILGAVLLIVQGVAEGLLESMPILLDKLPIILAGIITFLVQSMPMIEEAGAQLLGSLMDNMPAILNMLAKAMPKLIQGIILGLMEHYPEMLQGGSDLLMALVEVIPEVISAFLLAIPEFFDAVITSFNEALPDIKRMAYENSDKVVQIFLDMLNNAKEWGKDLLENFISGIKSKFDKLKGTVKSAAQTVKDFLGFSEPKEGPLSDFHKYAPDMIDLFVKGLHDNIPKLNDAFEEMLLPDQASPIVNSRDMVGLTGARGGVTMNIYAAKMTPAEVFEESRIQLERMALMNV